MKTKSLFALLFIFPFTCFSAIAQRGCDLNLLDSLSLVLFPPTSEMVPVTTFFGREHQSLDSIYMVRKEQPSFEAVQAQLVQFAYQHRYDCLDDLMAIYKKQKVYFQQEWEAVYRQNYYPCEAAAGQIFILMTFEQVFHSLKFGAEGLSSTEKMAYYERFLKSQYDYYYGKRDNAYWENNSSNFPMESPYFKQLLEKKWIGGPIRGFGFMAPYIGEIDELIAAALLPYFEQKDSLQKQVSFEQFELQNFCQIIGLSKNAAYNEAVLKLVLDNQREPANMVFMHIIDLWHNQNYRDNMKPYLLQAAATSDAKKRENALRSLSIYHDMDVLKFYQKSLKVKHLSATEKEIIGIHLSILYRQLNATPRVKRKGERMMRRWGLGNEN